MSVRRQISLILSRGEKTQDAVAFIKNLLLGLRINPAKLASMSASWPALIAPRHRCLRGREAVSWVEICTLQGRHTRPPPLSTRLTCRSGGTQCSSMPEEQYYLSLSFKLLLEQLVEITMSWFVIFKSYFVSRSQGATKDGFFSQHSLFYCYCNNNLFLEAAVQIPSVWSNANFIYFVEHLYQESQK